MNKLDQFINYIIQFINWAIYVWGGQGEMITSERQIRSMETSSAYAKRAIKLWKERGSKPIPGFDCSGIGVQALIILGLIVGDTTANGLMHKCKMIKRSELKRGDWVFRVHASGAKKGQAYHIGYIIDNALNAVEAMGRDDGVVLCGLDEHTVKGYWTHYGRPSYFKDEIESQSPAGCPYTEPTTTYNHGDLIEGNDAKWFKYHLNRIGYHFNLALPVKEETWKALDYEIKQARQQNANAKFRAYLESVPSR